MKKAAVLVCILAAMAGLLFLGIKGGERTDGEYLRVHIRANSNSEQDQAVKYRVRDAVVAYLTPTVAECGSKAEAMREIGKRLEAVASVADGVLREEGYDYGARASLRREEFPTRVYDGATLEAGVYDALILELGTGEGDNWWCVVYPPLCFTAGNGNVVYRSKIAELIRRFYGQSS